MNFKINSITFSLAVVCVLSALDLQGLLCFDSQSLSVTGQGLMDRSESPESFYLLL